MIRSFRNRLTEAVFNGGVPKGFQTDIVRIARRKLEAIHAAHALDDLRSPPGNRLEALKGDRAGQYSIWINDQFRMCFLWSDGGAENVEIVDYH